MTDLTELRKIAEAATPGPWFGSVGGQAYVWFNSPNASEGQDGIIVRASDLTPVPSLEDVARTMYSHRESVADSIDGWTDWGDLPESWRDEWRDAAREVMRLFGVGDDDG